MINFLYSPKSQTQIYTPESVVSFTILPFQISLRPHDLQAKSHFIYYWLQTAEAVPVPYFVGFRNISENEGENRTDEYKVKSRRALSPIQNFFILKFFLIFGLFQPCWISCKENIQH